MRTELFTAFRYLKSHRRERFISLVTLISVLGIFLGVMALIVIISLVNGFQSEIRDKILGTNAHIYLLRFGDRGISNYDSLMSVIKQHQEVKAVAPFIYSKGLLIYRRKADGIIIRGIDPEMETAVTTAKDQIIEGEYALIKPDDTLNNLPSILLGIELAKRNGLTVGDTVILGAFTNSELSTKQIAPKMRRFRISGIFRSGFMEFDANIAYIRLDVAQDIFELDKAVTGIGLKVKDLDRAPIVASQLIAQLGFPYRANDWTELNSDLFTALRVEKTLIWVVLTLIILVAAFTIATALIMMVIEKRRDIAILKAMGAPSGMIMRIFILNGFVIGVVGVITGILAGLATLEWVVNPAIRFIEQLFSITLIPPSIYFIDKLPSEVKSLDVFWICLIAMVISITSTIYPAFKAAHTDPVEVIRYE